MASKDDFDMDTFLRLQDYHHTEECAFAMYTLGVLTVEWNYLEHQLSVLIWQMIGDTEAGMAITSLTGNVSRSELLENLFRIIDGDEKGEKVIKHVRKSFNMA